MASLYYLHDDVAGGPDGLDHDDFDLGESAYAQSYQPVFDDFDLVDEEEPAKAQKIPFSSSQTSSSSSSSSSLLVAKDEDAKQPDQWSRCYQTISSPPVEEQSVSPLSRSPEDTRSRYSPSEPGVAPSATKALQDEPKMGSTPPQVAPLPPMLHNTAGKERGPAAHQFLSSHRLIRNVCRKSPSLSNLEPFLPKKTLTSSSHELSDDPSVSILQNIIEAKHASPPSSSSTGYAESGYDVDVDSNDDNSNNEDDNDADFDLADSYNVADDGPAAYSPAKQQTTDTKTKTVSEVSTQQNGNYVQSLNAPVAKPKKTPHNILKRRNVQIALTQMQTGKNWNKEFQELELMQFLKEKYDFLAQLAEDFVQTSTAYAKIIISELCMPDTQKTIKPASVGGVAGGTKFLVQGILFKVAMDVEVTKGIWMYGGDTPRDDFAMKAANKEMTGLSACWQQHLPGLQFPLMAVIDYKGFRVVAVSLLPVGKNSLRYGSNDGGRTVHADDPVLNESMKQLMEGNFLKGHMVGSNPNNRKMIYGPGDIEGHLGSDGLYYVLDFGRMMPPEAPSTDPVVRKQEPRSVFYKLFRNEFLVRSYRKPLCSDAFTGWDASEPAVAEQNRQEIRDASNFLYKSLIPEFAAFFEIKTHKVLNHYLTTPAITTYLQNNPLPEGTHFSVFDAVVDDDQAFRQRKKTIQDILDILYTSLHLQGINLRHLGRLRSLCTDPISRKLILSAACARCIKHNVHLLWRETMVQESVPSEIPFTSNAVRFLNTLLGTGGCQSSTDDLQELKKLNEEQADFFWQQDIKQQLQQSFAMGLSPAELDPNYDLRDSIDMVILLQQLFYDLRLKLRKSVQKHLYSLNHDNLRAGEFMFVRGDIKAMFEKVRSLPIANYSQSMSDLLESHELTPFIHLDFEFQFSEQPIAERINALNQRLESFAQGKNSRHLREYERARLLKSACNNFARTLRLIPLCFFVPNHWAFSEIALADLSITPQQQKRQLYLSAIERVNAVDNQKAKWIYFSQSYAYYKYATFLQSIGDQEQANKFFKLSADKEVASAAGFTYGGCDVFGKQGHTRVDEWEQPSLS